MDDTQNSQETRIDDEEIPWLFTPKQSQSDDISSQSSLSQQILDDFEAETKKGEESVTREILGIVVAHGSKYVRKEITSLHDLQEYIKNVLEKQPWYPFVIKNYFFTTAVFGNPSLYNPIAENDTSAINQALRINCAINKVKNEGGYEGNDRINCAKGTCKAINKYWSEPTKYNSTIGKQVTDTYRYTNKAYSDWFPTKQMARPDIPRISYLPSIWYLSGINTISQFISYGKTQENNERNLDVDDDKLSGIFLNILKGTNSKGEKKTFHFPYFFNLAVEEYIFKIFECFEPSIQLKNSKGELIDGRELVIAFNNYFKYWNNMLITNGDKSSFLKIELKKDSQMKDVEPFIIKQLNSINGYVLSNLVLEFLLVKTDNPDTDFNAYIRSMSNNPNIGSMSHEERDIMSMSDWVNNKLMNINSKVFWISTACETVSSRYINNMLLPSISEYLTDKGVEQTETQQELAFSDEGGGGLGNPSTIPFVETVLSNDLNDVLSQPSSSITDRKRPNESIGGKRKTRKIKIKKRNTKKRNTKKQRSKKRRSTRKYK